MKHINSIHRISLMYIKAMLELLLCAFTLMGIYLYTGLTSQSLKVVAQTVESIPVLLEYGMMSLMLVVGIGLFMDYVLKKENIS